MSANGGKATSNMYGIFISVALAGTIAGVSILFAYAASHGDAFNGITQLLTPQSQNMQQVHEEKKDDSSTNAAEANQEQETKVTAIEVKREQNQPAPDQGNEDSIKDNSGKPAPSSGKTEFPLSEQKANEKPVNSPVNSAADNTAAVSDTAPPLQELALPDKSQDTKPENNDDKPYQGNDHSDPVPIPSLPSQSADVPTIPPPEPTKVQEKKQVEEQQKVIKQREEQQKKEQEQQLKLMKEKNELEEKLHKQTEELQKKIQEVLEHNADNADEAEKKLHELYAKTPDTLQYLFGDLLQFTSNQSD
jgi:hypothetical protein